MPGRGCWGHRRQAAVGARPQGAPPGPAASTQDGGRARGGRRGCPHSRGRARRRGRHVTAAPGLGPAPAPPRRPCSMEAG